ncbi:MAG TPA: hypothetical protein VGB22_04370 [candidate division Zixibacteria bacterium]
MPTDPPRRPPFVMIDGWPAAQEKADFAMAATATPPERAVARLCAFYGRHFDPDEAWRQSPSPLEWPSIFAGQRMKSRRSGAEMKILLQSQNLAFRRIICGGEREMFDSLTAALDNNIPVAGNAPESPVFYGYDRREPGHWWWVTAGDRAQIVLEAERIRRFVWWDDDPAANIMWAVFGTTEFETRLPEPGQREFRMLEAVQRSVQGNPVIDLPPYPQSLVQLRDSLTMSLSLPLLRDSTAIADPLGIDAAIRARGGMLDALGQVIPLSADTSLTEPLRLALYFYTSSQESLGQLRQVMYGSEGHVTGEALAQSWGNAAVRRRAAALLNEVLAVERKAAEAIGLALAARSE